MGFLYKVVFSLRSAHMWIFMYRKDILWVECWVAGEFNGGVEVVHEILHGLELFGSA